MQKRPIIALCALLLAAFACQSQQTPTKPAPSVTTNSGRGAMMGVAGLIPPHFPNATSQDWNTLFTQIPETGRMLGVYTSWRDNPQSEGNTPKVFKTAFDLAKRDGLQVVAALSYFHDGPNNSLVPDIDWNDAAQSQRAVQSAVSVAKSYHPAYLALGVEVNRYATSDPAGFEAYLKLYEQSYDAVKAASPQTQIFPVFQYELMRGGKFFQGDGQGTAQWDLLQRFGNRLDLAVFTSYPYLLYATPGDLPANYYSEIAAHTSQKIAFTELGWPSAALSAAPDSSFGGSDQEQADFIRRFFDLTANTPLTFALWSFPNDPAGNVNPAFESVALRDNAGQPKPALAVWESFQKGR